MSAVLGMMGQKRYEPGDVSNGVWHRVMLNTIVRRGVDLGSERLRILPMGSKVLVVEQRERRVRISQPIGGWCSLHSSNGDMILVPLDSRDPEAMEEAVRNAKDQLERKGEAQAMAVGEVIKTAAQSSNANIQKMSKDLQELQSQLADANKNKNRQKQELEEIKIQNDADQENIKLKQQELQQLNEIAKDKENELTNLLRLIQESSSVENADLKHLSQTSVALVDEVARLERDLREKQKLIEALEKENRDRKGELDLLFQNNLKDVGIEDISESKGFRPEDVLQTNKLGPCGAEICIIKYWGRPPDDPMVDPAYRDELEVAPFVIGIERQIPPNSYGHSGQGLYECKAQCGMWLLPTHVKQIITPAALLRHLESTVQELAKNQNYKE